MSLDAMRALRGYRRIYATTNLLVLCAFLVWAYLSLDLGRNAAATVAVAAWSLFTLGFHGLLPDRFFTWRMLFYGSIADLLFATVLVWFSGQESSPFFFVYMLIVMSGALALGLRHSFVLAACASALYLLVCSAALDALLATSDAVGQQVLELSRPMAPAPGQTVGPSPALLEWSQMLGLALVRTLSHVWANLAALWLTAYVAGYFALEMQRVRETVQTAREKVEGFSRIDWLTGLYNRRHFDYLLGQEINRAERYGRPLTLLLADSDNLKVVNDTFGHQAGDQLLSALASILRTDTRLGDTVVRYGGDEFVILLPDTDPVGGHFLAERLRAAVQEGGFVWQSQPVPVTITIGLASLPQDATDGASLLARADAALYVGKRAGRNRVVAASEASPATVEPAAPDTPRTVG
jgi:diguanylate cyclase (GGDEF)-like protein